MGKTRIKWSDLKLWYKIAYVAFILSSLIGFYLRFLFYYRNDVLLLIARILMYGGATGGTILFILSRKEEIIRGTPKLLVMKKIVDKYHLEEIQITRDKKFVSISYLVIYFVVVLIPTDVFIYVLITIPEKNVVRSWGFIAFLQGMFLFVGLIPLTTIIKQRFPIFRVNLLINKEKIEIFLRDQLYLKEMWKNIKKIEMINEISYLSKYFYRLKFFTENDSKDLILYLLELKTSQFKMIITTIENISKIYNLPLEKRVQKVEGFYGNIYKNEIAIVRELLKKPK